jgi:outer membrane protein
MQRHWCLVAILVMLATPCFLAWAEEARADRMLALSAAPAGLDHPLTLEECIEIALKNNRRRPASRYAVELAEAQHKQALSTYWPQLNARVAYTLLD